MLFRSADVGMIDIHSHVLFGLDDGPEEIDGSIAICHDAVADGITTIVATPHVRDDHPTTAAQMQVKLALVRAEVGDLIRLLPGGEVALPELERPLDELKKFALGGKGFPPTPVALRYVGNVPFNGLRQACARARINLNISRSAHASVFGSSTLPVTLGLPSRSPPIHEPKRRNEGTSTWDPGHVSATATSISRYRRGTTSQSDVSKK